MPRLTRRDLLKSTLAASIGGAALSTLPTRAAAARALAVPGGRERLLLDRNWRFAFGHASNPAYDFGFGGGNDWDKVGEFLDPSATNFDASAWLTVDLPHDWAVELPFENAEELKEHGYKPIGRNYPATSIGWYRRVFQTPESDRGRRLFLDFDGVYRDAIAFNGLCCAIVQAGRDAGELRVVATAPGLEGATLVVPCRVAAARASLPA